ncbi:RNA polymerase subunit sigma-70 [bacterium 1xD42-62]|uniref:RNA polymerase subunit sigma-70 n=1 Tax=Parablautia muri TaxID=2320879 RepID=A0A9X5BGB7_9FIRM|nr:RNA polymerase subunit sigma-70 [Parablautia muri]
MLTTEGQKNSIIKSRNRGLGYGTIAKEVGLKKDAVAAFCRRNGLTGNRAGKVSEEMGRCCKECGAALVQAEGTKKRVFCCGECRKKWWKEHPEMLNKKAVYTHICAGCGRAFTAYGNSKRKYCSHNCYIKDRFKGGGEGD